ncbi:ABC transporter substrate-binding protein [Streptomyces sp. CA2R106]|jgi:peptide/nickel transport system substrate-binding protein|uniref:ABC transporter substrate-binding protein n=1 Tax=Streptomyces sp. CA2R106 TaxID=3120153 RepID=UPI003007F369
MSAFLRSHLAPPAPARSRRLAVTVVATTLLGATACTAGSTAGGGSTSGAGSSSLVYAYRNEVTTLDPAQSSYAQTDNVDQLLYDTLVGYDSKGRMVPRLATASTYAKDLTSVSITLRDGVTFHDGTPLTAADVAYSLDRYRDLKSGIAAQISTYASAQVTDAHHLTLRLKKADPLFLGALSRVYIVDSALVKQHAGSDRGQSYLLDHDAGSGPYTLKSASAGTYTTTRYARYWDFEDDRPRTFTMRRIDEFATVRDELKAGTVDLGQVSPDSAADLKSAGLQTQDISGGQAVIYFNTSHGPLADKSLREALRAAYDYAGGLKNIRAGRGTLADGPLPTNMTCRPKLPAVHQDLAAAKKDLAAAGLKSKTLTMRYQPAFAEQAGEATLLQSDLKQIGVTLKLQPIAFADYLTMLDDPAKIPDIMLLTESAPYPDAGVMVADTYSSAATGTNKGAYHDAKVDALLNQAARSADAATRCGLYEDAQKTIDADAASMPLYTIDNTYAGRADIGGVTTPAAAGGVSLRDLTVGAGRAS